MHKAQKIAGIFILFFSLIFSAHTTKLTKARSPATIADYKEAADIISLMLDSAANNKLKVKIHEDNYENQIHDPFGKTVVEIFTRALTKEPKPFVKVFRDKALDGKENHFDAAIVIQSSQYSLKFKFTFKSTIANGQRTAAIVGDSIEIGDFGG